MNESKINSIIDVVSGEREIKVGIDNNQILLLCLGLAIAIFLGVWGGRKLS